MTDNRTAEQQAKKFLEWKRKAEPSNSTLYLQNSRFGLLVVAFHVS
jgi:hypothetical protein